MADSRFEVEIRLLGEPRLAVRGQTVAFRTARVAALLGYLATHTGRSSFRTGIAEALWPNRESGIAQHNLRQTILRLRQNLGEVADRTLTVSRRDVNLRAGEFWCDLFEFREHLAAGRLSQAIELYRGPFLDGIEDEWVLPFRADLAQELVRGLVSEAGTRLESDPGAALGLAERAIGIETFHEGARARKIQALRAMGEESLALREYEDYEALLANELGLRPSRLVEEALDEPAVRAETVTEPPDVGLDAVYETLLASESPQEAVRLAVATTSYWTEIGQHAAGLRQISKIYDACPTEAIDPILRAEAALSVANLAMRSGESRRAIEQAEVALALGQSREVRASACVIKAWCTLRERRTKETKRSALLALRIVRGDPASQPIASEAWNLLSAVYLYDGLELRAKAAARHGLDAAGKSARAYARAGMRLAFAEAALGNVSAAREAIEFTLKRIERERSYPTSDIRVNAARLFEEIGDIDRAEEGYEASVEEIRGYESPWMLSVVLTYLADLRTARGRAAESIPLHEEAREMRGRLNDRVGEATSLRGLGRAYLQIGRLEDAANALRDAVRMYSEAETWPGVASCLLPLARIEAQIGSAAIAQRLLERAIRLLQGMSPSVRATIGPNSHELLPEAESLLREICEEGRDQPAPFEERKSSSQR